MAITADEVRKISIQHNDGLIGLCKRITEAAMNGDTSIHGGYLEQADVDALRALGYKVDDPCDDCQYDISW